MLEIHPATLVGSGALAAFLHICERVEYVEGSHFLRFDASGVAGIFDIRLKEDAIPTPVEMAEAGVRSLQILSKDGKEIVAYVEIPGRPLGALSGEDGTVHVVPIGIQGLGLRVALFGEGPSLRSAVSRLRAMGVDFRVLSLSDARFDPNSPLSDLTERQRQVIMAAYKHGYFAHPRRTNSEQLARILQLDKSTVVEHLRKAEDRLMATLIGGR